jgi:hypothetical protein
MSWVNKRHQHRSDPFRFTPRKQTCVKGLSFFHRPGGKRPAHSEVMEPYKTIVDRYDGTVYPNMIVVVLDGVTSYNSYISHTPPFKWIIHPNWYYRCFSRQQ